MERYNKILEAYSNYLNIGATYDNLKLAAAEIHEFDTNYRYDDILIFLMNMEKDLYNAAQTFIEKHLKDEEDEENEMESPRSHGEEIFIRNIKQMSADYLMNFWDTMCDKLKDNDSQTITNFHLVNDEVRLRNLHWSQVG